MTSGATFLFVLFALASVVLGCNVDLGLSGSTDCPQTALFCTWPTVDAVDLDCRPCHVNPSGPLPGLSVSDPFNVCNCLPGEYCRQTGNGTLGQCMTSEILGLSCLTDDDCEGVREAAVDGFSRRERAFCVQGRCSQCNPATFQRDWSSTVATCHGFQLNGDGERVYHNARPGTTFSCSPDGTLTTSGAIDWNYQSVWAATSSTTTPNPVKDKEGGKESIEAAIISMVLIIPLFCGTIMLACLTVILVYVVRLWRRTERI